MKMLKLAALSLAVFVWATTALAQHGHAGGMGGGMGSSMGHGSMNTSDHDKSTTTGTGSSHQATISSILDKNPAIGDKIVALTGDKLWLPTPTPASRTWASRIPIIASNRTMIICDHQQN